jgi:hypothetical protein
MLMTVIGERETYKGRAEFSRRARKCDPDKDRHELGGLTPHDLKRIRVLH